MTRKRSAKSTGWPRWTLFLVALVLVVVIGFLVENDANLLPPEDVGFLADEDVPIFSQPAKPAQPQSSPTAAQAEGAGAAAAAATAATAAVAAPPAAAALAGAAAWAGAAAGQTYHILPKAFGKHAVELADGSKGKGGGPAEFRAVLQELSCGHLFGGRTHVVPYASQMPKCENCFDFCAAPFENKWTPKSLKVNCDGENCAVLMDIYCKGHYSYPHPGYIGAVTADDGCLDLPSGVVHLRFVRLEAKAPLQEDSLPAEAAHDYSYVLRRMRYWRGPAEGDGRAKPPTNRYVTFNTDCGGFNNIRMGFEHAVLMAWVTKRTLVLPPPRPWYLLDTGPIKREREAGRGQSDYADYWDMGDLARAIPVLSHEDFLKHAGQATAQQKAMLPIEPFITAILWPTTAQVTSSGILESKKGKSLLGHRRTVELSPDQLAMPVLHFPACEKPYKEPRFLNQVSGVVIFARQKLDLALKAFFKHSLHYVDTIFAVASRVITAMGLFNYTALHVRRNDLQYKEVHIPAGGTLANIRALVPAGEPLYLATDEVAPAFFAALEQRHPVYRWHDFLAAEGGFALRGAVYSPKVVGMIEQVVCAGARRFFGTQHSTFSSHIARLRGYVDAPDKQMRYHSQRSTGDETIDALSKPRISGDNYMVEDPSLWEDVRD